MARVASIVVIVVLAFGYFGTFLSLTSASPVCKCSDSADEPTTEPVQVVHAIERFKVHVNELGQKYDEEAEIDTEKETERYHVPAHNGISEADFLFDFKMNLTMIRNPTEKTCFLLKTDPDVPRPRDAKAAFNRMIKSPSKLEAKKVTSTWKYSSMNVDRSALSDELAEFCAKYPIIQLEATRDSTSVEEEQSTLRVRRQASVPLCTTPTCASNLYKCRVKVETKCVYIYSCTYERNDNDINSPSSLVCVNKHRFFQVVCCDPDCSNSG